MKITMEMKEVEALKEICSQISKETGTEFVDFFKEKEDIGLIKFGPKVTKRGIIYEIECSPEFITEYINLYGKYIPMFTSQMKMIYQSAVMFYKDTEQLASKYYKDMKEE